MLTLDDRIAALEQRLKALRRERARRRRLMAWRDPAKRSRHGQAISAARIAGHSDFAGFSPAQLDLYRALRTAGYRRAEAIDRARSA